MVKACQFCNKFDKGSGYSSRVFYVESILRRLNFNLNKRIDFKYISPNTIKKIFISLTRKTNPSKERSFLVPIPGSNLFFRFFAKNILSKAVNNYSDLHNTVVVAETYFPAIIALLLRDRFNLKVICDVHGAQPEEIIENKNNKSLSWGKKIIFKLLNHCERIVYEQSDGIIFVSNAMKNHVESKLNIKVNNHIILPCAPNIEFFDEVINKSDTFSIDKLGLLKDKLTMVYSGTLFSYQCIPKMLNLWSEICELTDFNFLFLTAQKDEAIKLVNEIWPTNNLHRIRVFSAEKEEIPKILNECDLGFLLRDNSITNKVSYPTKFGEYVSSGLPVVLTQYAGDPTCVAKENDLGIIVDYDNIEPQSIIDFALLISENKKHWRVKCMNYSKNNYDANCFAEQLRTLVNSTNI